MEGSKQSRLDFIKRIVFPLICTILVMCLVLFLIIGISVFNPRTIHIVNASLSTACLLCISILYTYRYMKLTKVTTYLADIRQLFLFQCILPMVLGFLTLSVMNIVSANVSSTHEATKYINIIICVILVLVYFIYLPMYVPKNPTMLEVKDPNIVTLMLANILPRTKSSQVNKGRK